MPGRKWRFTLNLLRRRRAHTGRSRRRPGGHDIGQESIEGILVFAGEDGGFGAPAVDEGVEADFGLALGCFGAGGSLRVAAIGLDLLDGRHSFFSTEQSQFGWAGAGADVD